MAGARSSSSDLREHSQQLLQAVSQLSELGKHIRSNTADIKKQMSNVQWEMAELRTGGRERDSGAITAQSGSLPYWLQSEMDSKTTSIPSLKGL